ncbi:MAG: class I SAM-dependent methyltransferase [Candidatus Gracilibacteria bacterium]|nr:class I SAM-dependent methyltransferase [Candidatus Gracilibacteria bacterium]
MILQVDYNNFAKTFSKSRENMKWEEIEYFLGNYDLEAKSVLDIGCGNGRFLSAIKEKNINFGKYLGLDLSSGLLEEASKLHPENEFLNLNMLDLDKIESKFDTIFFIASFHHLQKLEDRIEVLKKARNLLSEDGKIFFTNWNLIGQEKYKKSKIENSQNEFLSLDFNIKIGEFDRYYHGFSLKELDYLFKEALFELIENRVFDSGRNIISIVK